MKACFKCQKTKPLDEFYAHPQMADGHLNKCKVCTRADSLRHREDNLDAYKTYDRMRAKKPHRVEARREYSKTYKKKPERDPMKRAARLALGNAVKAGKVVKPEICDVCSQPAPLHGHHDDYSKPLEVIWCCVPCHTAIHAYWRAKKRKAA